MKNATKVSLIGKINVKMSVFTTWRYRGAEDIELHSSLTSPPDGGK